MTCPAGLAKCSRCKEEKPATREFFFPNKRKSNGLDSWCNACRKLYRNEICRGKFRHVISDEDLKKLKARAKCCKICKARVKLVVDHDHQTEQIRGMLCHSCNRGLGHFKDNTRYLASAIRYLNKSRSK